MSSTGNRKTVRFGYMGSAAEDGSDSTTENIIPTAGDTATPTPSSWTDAVPIKRQGVPTTNYCDHHHKKNTCWEIHGKPPNWKPRSRPYFAHNEETTTDSNLFNGTMAKVSGIGSVKISNKLTLLNVLHDLASGKMIGNAKEYNGLYILGSSTFPAFNKTVLSVNCPPDILLWHNRLGHPNFHYMQKLFGKVYTRRYETQTKNHTTPMMQTEDKNPMPSPANSEDSDEGHFSPMFPMKSKKQSVVASSAKAEFKALSQAISIAKHPVHHDRTKNVEIDRHFIKENLDYGNINLSHTPSHLQPPAEQSIAHQLLPPQQQPQPHITQLPLAAGDSPKLSRAQTIRNLKQRGRNIGRFWPFTPSSSSLVPLPSWVLTPAELGDGSIAVRDVGLRRKPCRKQRDAVFLYFLPLGALRLWEACWTCGFGLWAFSPDAQLRSRCLVALFVAFCGLLGASVLLCDVWTVSLATLEGRAAPATADFQQGRPEVAWNGSLCSLGDAVRLFGSGWWWLAIDSTFCCCILLLNKKFKVVMGLQRLAIEAKTFDLSVEQSEVHKGTSVGARCNDVKVDHGAKAKEQGNDSTFRKVLRIFLEDGGNGGFSGSWKEKRKVPRVQTQVQQRSSTQNIGVQTVPVRRDVGVQTEEAEMVTLGDVKDVEPAGKGNMEIKEGEEGEPINAACKGKAIMKAQGDNNADIRDPSTSSIVKHLEPHTDSSSSEAEEGEFFDEASIIFSLTMTRVF
ncbi:Retrovirus-related Pol polyprotein from transposon TNT 1-94 [Senna tora]|uniref:Retrovirus-related Pol polyprotein from transposon TNT 1-94 n=1 Tax=Senna tora TaxID=362788 RepID=A0A834TUJ2_9FABA|nr:Retrovirus-related Pol polyprotein from transposon TNT 1-94 [Senna tora]